MGTLLLSTSRGLLTDREARFFNVGGEVLLGIRLFLIDYLQKEHFFNKMNYISLPPSISLFIAPNFLKVSGPRGARIFRIDTGFSFNVLRNDRGQFLTVKPNSLRTPTLPPTTVLALIQQYIEGLTTGFRTRLRLEGVGFRAVSRQDSSQQSPTLSLKLGYSHPVLLSTKSIHRRGCSITPSRLEGRSKGRLLLLQGSDVSRVNQAAATVRRFRKPDPYKGKGIRYDGEQLILKKGKREA